MPALNVGDFIIRYESQIYYPYFNCKRFGFPYERQIFQSLKNLITWL